MIKKDKSLNVREEGEKGEAGRKEIDSRDDEGKEWTGWKSGKRQEGNGRSEEKGVRSRGD